MLCFNSTWQKLGIEAMVEDPNNVEAVVIFPKVIEYVLLDDETISDVDDEAAATTSNREANGDGGYPIVVVVDVDDDIMVQTRKMAYLLFTCFHQTARNFPIAMFECFGLCFHDVPLSSCCLSLSLLLCTRYFIGRHSSSRCLCTTTTTTTMHVYGLILCQLRLKLRMLTEDPLPPMLPPTSSPRPKIYT